MTNKQILSTIKGILVPSFVYQYHTSLVDLSYGSQLEHNLKTAGASIIKTDESMYSFSIKTANLMDRFRFGKTIVFVKSQKNNEFEIKLHFTSQQKGYFIFSGILIFLVLFKALIAGRVKLDDLLIVPVVLFFGHVYFWGGLAANVLRIKKYFHSIAK